MPYRVVFSPEARDDLLNIYLYISERAGEPRAMAYIRRIEAYCRGFETFPERGARRDNLMPSLRVVGFERRVPLAFHVDTDKVTFDRILYGGQDLPAVFGEGAP